RRWPVVSLVWPALAAQLSERLALLPPACRQLSEAARDTLAAGSSRTMDEKGTCGCDLPDFEENRYSAERCDSCHEPTRSWPSNPKPQNTMSPSSDDRATEANSCSDCSRAR